MAFNDTIVFHRNNFIISNTTVNLHLQCLTHFSSPLSLIPLPLIHLADAQQKRQCSNLILSLPFQLSCDTFALLCGLGPPRPSNQYSLFSFNLGKNVFTIWQIIFLAYHTHTENGKGAQKVIGPISCPRAGSATSTTFPTDVYLTYS